MRLYWAASVGKFFLSVAWGGGGHKIDLVSLSEGSRSPRAKATVTTSEGLRCPRARVAVSGLHERTVTVSTGQGSGVCKRGSKASRCPPRGPSCLRAKSRGLYERRPLFRERGSWCLRVAVSAKVADFASEGPRSPRARCRARLYTCRARVVRWSCAPCTCAKGRRDSNHPRFSMVW